MKGFPVVRLNDLYYKILLFQLLFLSALNAQQDESWKVFEDSEVATIEITIDPARLEWMYTPENFKSDSIHPAKIRFKNSCIDQTIDSVGFRLRGNTSRFSEKKSFKISFNSFTQGGDLYGLEKLNLNGEHNDPSIARSKICWDLFGIIDMKASRAAHAAVYINNEYYGLYLNVEHIDEEFIERNFTDDSGNLWKCLFKADLTYHGDDPAIYSDPYVAGFNYELKTNKEKFDYSNLIHLIRILNDYESIELADTIEKIVNLKDVLKYLAFNIYVGSWDDYRFLSNNFYLYYEPAVDLIYLIPYDYDNTFGISWSNTDWSDVDPYDYPIFQPGSRPLSDKLLQIDKYKNLFSYYLKFMNDELYSLPLWYNDLNDLRSKLTSFVENDVYRTMDYGFTLDDFYNSYRAQPYINHHVRCGIKEFVIKRHNSLNDMIEFRNAEPFIYDLKWYPKDPGPEDSIFVYAYAFGYPEITEMNIAYMPGDLTIIEEHSMSYKPAEDSFIPEEHNRWIGVIPPLGPNAEGRFTVSAMNENGDVALFRNGETKIIRISKPATGELLINELMARNSNIISDENGEYDDWVEIFNPGTEIINLKNKFITDSRDNLIKWRFKDDLILDPGKMILVWCDDDSSQGDLHTNFKLDGDGEFLAIIDSDGTTFIDSVSFDEQRENVSWGRDYDNNSLWGFMSPSPGQSNTVVSVDQHNDTVPGIFNIFAYPNPFNPSTTIYYQLSAVGNVSVEIYNILGELVWSKYSDYQSPGSHEILWNGRSDENSKLNSGFYLVKVTSGNQIRTTKIIMVK